VNPYGYEPVLILSLNLAVKFLQIHSGPPKILGGMCSDWGYFKVWCFFQGDLDFSRRDWQLVVQVWETSGSVMVGWVKEVIWGWDGPARWIKESQGGSYVKLTYL